MARRKRGRPLTGWLVVDKAAGPTSTDVVNKARWLLSARKAGHGGTLDPTATGLLVLAFGEATKALSHITEATKTYRFAVRWGAETDTDDAQGTVPSPVGHPARAGGGGRRTGCLHRAYPADPARLFRRADRRRTRL